MAARSKSAPYGRMIGTRCLRPSAGAAHNLYGAAFSSPKRGFSEREIAFFMDIDSTNHVALVAQADEDGQSVIVGGGRYIIVQPGRAELAFAVVDAYQGKGIATMLMRHLLAIAREAGLKELTAEVLPENAAMLKVFSRFGFRAGSGSDPQVRHLTLQLA
jgi:RimJ/RimL family protein N-acetyltransferase